MDELYEMPGHLIRRAQQIATALFAEHCAEFGVTPLQFAALSAIEAHPHIDATRLASLVALDRSTVGEIVERMETKRWIIRKPDAQDRRVKLLQLSPTGTRLLRKVKPVVHQVQDRILAPLAPRDRALFVRLLMDLARLHNEPEPAPTRVAPKKVSGRVG